MKVVLVFRDKSKKGKSIEGIFHGLLKYGNEQINLSIWEYDARKSLFVNLKELFRLNGEIIHITGDIYYLTCFLFWRDVVITIHDIGRFKELHGIKKWIYGKLWIYWPVKLAKRVTVVSNYTRNDLLLLFPSANEKIQVISNGYHQDLKPKPQSFNAVIPRILQVGTAAHKNIETLFRAIHGLKCVLSIVGPLTEDHKKELNTLKIIYENYIELEPEMLKKQYEMSDIVVFVSTHEGFGMPIIEAQAIGRPLITSRQAAIPEIAGEGAYFMMDPFDTNELAYAIKLIMEDEHYRNSIIEAGFKNVKKYTFDIMARQYLDLYERLGRA